MSRLNSTYSLYTYSGFSGGVSIRFVLILLLKAALLFILWKKEITRFFGVSDEMKKRTAIIVVFGSLILMALTYLTLA